MSKIILNKLNSLQLNKSSKKNWNITWVQGVFLSNLVDIKKPKNILEIGTSNGFSTLWIAKSLDEDAFIDTIEINSERFEEAKKVFNQCSLKNVNPIFGDVFEILPTLGKKYDFVFMDAKQEFYLDLVKLIEKLELFGEDFTFVVDNVTNHDNMGEFVKYMEKNYTCEVVDIGGGFLIAKARKGF